MLKYVLVIVSMTYVSVEMYGYVMYVREFAKSADAFVEDGIKVWRWHAFLIQSIRD